MKNIYIVIYEDIILSSAAAPLDIFTRTNDILARFGKPPAFKVQLVSEKFSNITLSTPAQFICQKTLADIPAKSSGHKQSLIIVPAFSNEWDIVREKNLATINWLKEHYAVGTEIASLCVGSYFLAEAGLLNNKTCTSHWGSVQDMQQRFPQLQVQADTVLTDQQGIYTGGGAFSSLNLVLYLVEKFCGHDIGVQVSKNFSIHRDHISQAHFSVFRGLNQHGDKLILDAQSLIEQNYNKNINIEDIATKVNMSSRNFVRRFKNATHYTPIEYLQRVRIEAAKKALENSNKSIQSIMYEVGYNDVKTFREIFKRITAVTPQVYRDKYGHQTIV